MSTDFTTAPHARALLMGQRAAPWKSLRGPAHKNPDTPLSPQGEPIPNYFPAVISKDEFHLLEQLRSERLLDSGAKAKKGTTVPNLLSGVVKCGYCGSTMAMITLSPR